jgi:hypothetical protein
MASRTEVLEAERPRLFHTRFASRTLRGTSRAEFAPDGDGTRVTQVFATEGFVSAILARIFAMGSYKGSFQGELNEFARLAEASAT